MLQKIYSIDFLIAINLYLEGKNQVEEDCRIKLIWMHSYMFGHMLIIPSVDTGQHQNLYYSSKNSKLSDKECVKNER